MDSHTVSVYYRNMVSAGFKKTILMIGDVAAYAGALFIAIAIRYPGRGADAELLRVHFVSFGVLFIVWLIVLYIYNLYDLRYLENSVEFYGLAMQAFTINTLLAIVYFYLRPHGSITPRTVLVFDIACSAALFVGWRTLCNRLFSHTFRQYVALASASERMQALAQEVAARPSLGYRIACFIDDGHAQAPSASLGVPCVPFHQLKEHPASRQCNLIVLDTHPNEQRAYALAFFSLLPQRVTFQSLPSFIEHVFQRVPLAEVSESWFLENLSEGEKNFFEAVKRLLDIAGAVALGILTLPIMALTALGIKLEDGRRVLYRQKRIGRDGSSFWLVKFQSMVESAEEGGPQWTVAHDPRVTRFGAFLRSTRLDELPQLWNVLKGDLSFIGPRPERPEFVQNLQKDIPFYAVRHLVRPGLSGWAQINNPLHSVAESYEKLEYDLYYIKNRSLALDTAIALKTLSIILRRKGR